MTAPHPRTTPETSERFPLHPHPTGWYVVAFSEDLPVGGVLPMRFLGRDVVAFRTTSGVAAVVDAWCPHLGAHLGHGGRVDGEELRCPMHHFGFGTDGACKSAGRGYKRPIAAGVGALAVREQSGLVLAWHARDGSPPAWEVPPLAPASGGAPIHRQHVIRTHVQELAENLFDIAHFSAVHGFVRPEIAAPPTIDGPVIRVGSRMGHSTKLLGFARTVSVEIGFEMYGLGVFVSNSVAEGGLSMRHLLTATPVGDEEVVLRTSLWITQGDATLDTLLAWLPRAARAWLVGRMVTTTLMRDVVDDETILSHKRYLPQPCYGDLDAGVPVLRRWARQFGVQA